MRNSILIALGVALAGCGPSTPNAGDGAFAAHDFASPGGSKDLSSGGEDLSAAADLSALIDSGPGGDLTPSPDLTFVCAKDADCSGKTPRCNVMTGACVVCLPVNDNCTNGSFCSEMNGAYQCAMGCKVNGDCPSGDGGLGQPMCCNHVCTDGLVDNANCGRCGLPCGNSICCSGSCDDLTMDVLNCGSCGNICTGGQALWSCTASKCAIASCNGTFHDCDKNPANGCEVDVSSDPKNCTACGMVCVAPNGVPACNNGCAVGMCNMGFADCDGNPQNGCEVNIITSLGNCGGCGNACVVANGSPACMGGMCGVGSCNPGFKDCNMNAQDGCEVNVVNDPANCGACGNACMGVPNGTVTCTNMVCGIGACSPNFKDCNMNPGDGCEVNVTNDLHNCGGCGNACAGVANGVAGCANGQCGIASCNGAFKDCDGHANNGCEVNSASDVNNCGGCNNVCPGVANGVAGCTNGACGIASCNANFLNCDGNANNGCEVNDQTDNNNCGGCAAVCSNGNTCVAGKCTSSSLLWTDNFVGGQSSTPQQCTTWNNYRALVTGNNYSTITIYGSPDPVGITCNVPATVNLIAAAIHSGGTFIGACNGHTWSVCNMYYQTSIWIDPPSLCSGNDCPSPAYFIRPCINNSNWGGIKTATCGPPTQTMDLKIQ